MRLKMATEKNKPGRPALPGRVKLTITMDKKIYDALIAHEGKRSAIIEQALRLLFSNPH